MTKYASDLEEFPDLLRAAAQSRKIPAAIVEKDYYLCRALRALAEGHGGQFILKGGTSLSKGWQLLQRFSEDIDLLVRSEAAAGKAAKRTRLRRLAATIRQAGGFRSETVVQSETGVHRTVDFDYDSVATDLQGLGERVRLEAGYRGNAEAAVTRRVRSIAAEFASTRGQAQLADDLASFELEVQSLERTFVEKLFAAHAAYIKDYAANGKARHYYDLYEMCSLVEVAEFAGTEAYRRCAAEVRGFSQRIFPGQALPEGDSFARSAAFHPDPEGLDALERNYKNEASLFFDKQPPISDVLRKIGKILPKL